MHLNERALNGEWGQRTWTGKVWNKKLRTSLLTLRGDPFLFDSYRLGQGDLSIHSVVGLFGPLRRSSKLQMKSRSISPVERASEEEANEWLAGRLENYLLSNDDMHANGSCRAERFLRPMDGNLIKYCISFALLGLGLGLDRARREEKLAVLLS